jgi:hypothetical protein
MANGGEWFIYALNENDEETDLIAVKANWHEVVEVLNREWSELPAYGITIRGDQEMKDRMRKFLNA